MVGEKKESSRIRMILTMVSISDRLTFLMVTRGLQLLLAFLILSAQGLFPKIPNYCLIHSNLVACPFLSQSVWPTKCSSMLGLICLYPNTIDAFPSLLPSLLFSSSSSQGNHLLSCVHAQGSLHRMRTKRNHHLTAKEELWPWSNCLLGTECFQQP